MTASLLIRVLYWHGRIQLPRTLYCHGRIQAAREFYGHEQSTTVSVIGTLPPWECSFDEHSIVIGTVLLANSLLSHGHTLLPQARHCCHGRSIVLGNLPLDAGDLDLL